MYSRRMLSDSVSIFVYAMNGPKLTSVSFRAHYSVHELTEQTQEVLCAVYLRHCFIGVRPLLLDVLRPLEPVQQVVAERFVKV